MLVSTDHRYLRTGTWQSELSRNEVFKRFPDKRSWWIDSSGEVFDSGKDHYQFIKEHPELFDDETILTYHAIKKFWVRVSAWGPSFTIQSRNINQAQLEAAQILYMHEGKDKKVEFFQEGVIQTSFDKEEFLALENVNQLKRMRTRIGSSSTRAWFVSPNGKVIDCGQSHDQCLRDRPEVFGNIRYLNHLIPMGWIRVGNVGYKTFIDCDRMTAKQLDKIQEIVTGISHETVEINKKDRLTQLTRGEFLTLNSPGEINRKRASLKILLSTDYKRLRVAGSTSDAMKKDYPEKRSWWVDPQGKIHDSGHDHNKFMEERPKTFGKNSDINKALTMNWVRVAFWGGEYLVHCHRITNTQLAACQEIYKSLGGEHKIFIAILDKTGYISNRDFIWADSASDLIPNLFKDPTGIRASVMATSEDSEFYKENFPEKRSWWVSPSGEAVDSGYNHTEFVREHPEVFGGVDLPYSVMQNSWIKVGYFGGNFYIEGNNINRNQLETAQSLRRSVGWVPYVTVDLQGKEGRIDEQEFLAIDSPNQLRRELWGSKTTIASASEWMKGKFPDKRSWWISPDGEGVYDAGYNHDRFLKEHPEIFGTDNPADADFDGWIRVGSMNQDFIFNGGSLSEKKWNEIKKLYHETNKPYVTVSVGHLSGRITKDEFLQSDTLTDLVKKLRTRFSSRRRATNEGERAWLISPKGEAYSCGHGHSDCRFNEELFKIAREFDPEIEGDGYEVSELLMDNGWARFGCFKNPSTAYLDATSYTRAMIRKCKEILLSLNMPGNTEVQIGPYDIPWNNFRFLDSMMEIRKFVREHQNYVIGSSRRQANGSDRAWMVSPQGEWIDCGHDHDTFIKNNRERFGISTLVKHPSSVWLVDQEGWVKVGRFETIIYLECRNLTQKILNQVQDFVLKNSGVKFVQVIDYSLAEGDALDIDRDDFIQMKRPSDLRWMFNINASRRSRRIGSQERAWLVSPEGEWINCGYDHNAYIREHEEKFDVHPEDPYPSSALVEQGWAKIGKHTNIIYLDCHKLTQKLLDQIQDFVLKDSSIQAVQVIDHSIGEALDVERNDFIRMNKPSDLRWMFNINASRRGRRASGLDRAWLITPENRVISCGSNHNKFIKENPGYFNIPTDAAPKDMEIDPSAWLVKHGWTKVGKHTTIIYFECVTLTQKLLDTLQDLVQGDESIKYVQAVVYLKLDARPIMPEISRKEFLSFDKPSELIRRPHVRARKQASVSGGRAWVISPEGEAYDCGELHVGCVLEGTLDHLLPESELEGKDIHERIEFVEEWLNRNGWAKVGCLDLMYNKQAYLDTRKLDDRMFKKFKDIMSGWDLHDRDQVEVSAPSKSVFYWEDFRWFDSVLDMKKFDRRGSRKRASLPKSRNFLMGVSIEEMPWPLRQAFDLLHLSEKKDKLSANQVASVFQSHDEFLQDHLGRTSTELIRDLNGFFQYGSKQKQTA